MWLTERHDDPMYDNLNLDDLDIDEFYVKFNFNASKKKNIYLLSKYRDCYKCPYMIKDTTALLSDTYKAYKSKPEEDWIFSFNNNESPQNEDNIIDKLCSFSDSEMNVGEFGVYEISNDGQKCTLLELKPPVNIYAGFFTVILLTLFFVACGYLLKFGYNKFKKINSNTELSKENEKKNSSRVKSLDTFRGISIVIMIFVNYGAGQYEFLEHATWNGLNVADLVFPWFMWIMGVCIPISIKSAVKRTSNRGIIFLNILRRSCILFMLGLFLNQGVKLDEIRIFGVLQRFSLCYLVVASLHLLCSKVRMPESIDNPKGLQIFCDIYFLIPQWIFILIIMTIHLAITLNLNVPDCPSGYLGPGGLHDGGKYWNCTGGAAGYIDKKILGVKHLYQHPTATVIYKSLAFDPEGLFGTMNSIVQVFIGAQAGTTLLVYKSHRGRLIRWLFWAVITGIIGGGLCGFSKEDGIIPVNKNLWSLSFVMVTSSFAFILLSLSYILIDKYKLWSGKPFLYPGMNATIMYVGHSLTYAFPFHWALSTMNTHYLYLARAVWGTTLWVIIAYKLYSNKFFLSI